MLMLIAKTCGYSDKLAADRLVLVNLKILQYKSKQKTKTAFGHLVHKVQPTHRMDLYSRGACTVHVITKTSSVSTRFI